jgi:hypothetical protein
MSIEGSAKVEDVKSKFTDGKEIVLQETQDSNSDLDLLLRTDLELAIMTESLRRENCEVGESSKLTVIVNYTIWSIKMEVILCRERVWSIVYTKQTPNQFPYTTEGIIYNTAEKLHETKQRVRSGLILFVSDSFVGLVAGKSDPANSWDVLKRMYNSRDQQQILLLTNKLFGISMKEGNDVSAYLMEANDIKDRLQSLGKETPDKTMISIVLNGLPRSNKMVI